MKWTRNKPTKPGAYWWRPNEHLAGEVVQVFSESGELWFRPSSGIERWVLEGSSMVQWGDERIPLPEDV